MVGEAQPSLDQPSVLAAPEEDAEALPASNGDLASSQPRRRRPQALKRDLRKVTDKIVFDEIELDEASEKAIEPLDEDEEVVVLMPAKEFVIRHGPKRTVLYWLCRSLTTTEKINGTLESQ